jgi:uncharacterized protein (TIGR02594 family)
MPATALPKQYAWLKNEGAPRLMMEGLNTFGTVETPGPRNNPAILQWAKVAKLGGVYTNDAIAWCGLWMAYTALQAGWNPPKQPLMARNWRKFGTPVPITPGRQGTPGRYPALGDVLIFWRGKPSSSSGHVGIYVGEDDACYHVLGGNQKDSVSITRIAKGRLLEARRCKWKINQPGNVRRVFLSPTGVMTTNEA